MRRILLFISKLNELTPTLQKLSSNVVKSCFITNLCKLILIGRIFVDSLLKHKFVRRKLPKERAGRRKPSLREKQRKERRLWDERREQETEKESSRKLEEIRRAEEERQRRDEEERNREENEKRKSFEGTIPILTVFL